MGFLDTLRSLASGSGNRTLPVVLEAGETEVARVVASYRPGRFTSVGGDLVLTNQRLVFTPLDTRAAVGILEWGLGKAGAADIVTKLPGQLGDLIKQEQVASLSGLVRVEAGTAAKTFCPPTVVLTRDDGTQVVIGILADRRRRNGDPANNVTRDGLLGQIEAVRSG